MSILAESLKRLYKDGKVTQSKLLELVAKGSITEQEEKYIRGDD